MGMARLVVTAVLLEGRLHHVGIGRRDGSLLRDLTLDPARDHPPQARS